MNILASIAAVRIYLQQLELIQIPKHNFTCTIIGIRVISRGLTFQSVTDMLVDWENTVPYILVHLPKEEFFRILFCTF